ncbi:MAG: sugar-binding domain-containing protein [Bacilli bacterium]
MIDYLFFPNPIFARKATTIINDGWWFSFDTKDWHKINVPFCPESKLSGIGYTDFIPQCFYKKQLDICKTDKRIVIHFGAVDYRCNLHINGKYVGSHVGGYTPFEFDITDYLVDGKNELLLTVFDNEQRRAPTGKQSYKQKSFGCFYTRTTGIWQDVWLEKVPEKRIKQFYFYPNIEDGFTVDLITNGCGKVKIEVFFNRKLVGSFCGEIEYRKKIEITLSEKHLWELGKGNLYDVVLTFEDDVVYSYYGLREVSFKGFEFLLNGKKNLSKISS